jgi:DNA repair protein RadC
MNRLKIREMPPSEQPGYRARAYGVEALSSAELLALICSFTHFDTATNLMSRAGNLSTLAHMSVEEMRQTPDVGLAAGLAIKAALELGRRHQLENQHQPQVSSPTDAAQIFMAEFGTKEQEHFAVMLLDTKNRVIGVETVYVGSINTVTIRTGEIFKSAIRRNANAIIVCHNHPSGDPNPSPEDVRVTRSIVEAGKLLDIEVLDHIVVGKTRHVSLKERGLGWN